MTNLVERAVYYGLVLAAVGIIIHLLTTYGWKCAMLAFLLLPIMGLALLVDRNIASY